MFGLNTLVFVQSMSHGPVSWPKQGIIVRVQNIRLAQSITNDSIIVRK